MMTSWYQPRTGRASGKVSGPVDVTQIIENLRLTRVAEDHPPEQ